MAIDSTENLRTKSILNALADSLLSREADQTAFHDEYDEIDVINTVQIFQSVLSLYGIKHNKIQSESDAEKAGRVLANLVLNMTGIDTRTFYKKDN